MSSVNLLNIPYGKGWLSPSGEFFSCKDISHDNYAVEVFGCSGEEMEKKGYVKLFEKVKGATVFAFVDILSPAQSEYVEDNNISVEYPFSPTVKK